MKQTPSTAARQFGGVSGKFLLVVAMAAIGYSVAKQSPTGQHQGQTAAELQATLGQPVAKEQIPRPS